MRFVSIDVETANARMSSICQIGLVVFEDGREIASDVTLVDPRDFFHGINIGIHGITDEHVSGAPTFADAFDWLSQYTADEIVVSHTHFDRVSITQACSFHGTASIVCRWLDSARVARRAWPQFAAGGYGLSNIAREFGISFQHHDALEDARTAALILQRALDESGQDLEFWFDRVEKSLSGEAKEAPIRRAGDGDGPLVGQTIVFTGALTIPRKAAADLAHVAGAAVEPTVNKSTTMLVVGDQDISRLAGASKSSKHRKVETMIEKGAPIMIVGETDFMAMVQ